MPVVHALGSSVRVDLGELDQSEFERAWSRCLTPPAATVSKPADMVGPAGSMTTLTQQITHTLIRQQRGRLLMFHAGAVCHPETGAAIAYAAPGGMGKTTLTRVLGHRYGYLSDETVGIEPESRRILPYPKPLSLRNADGRLPKTERGPDDLGLLPAHQSPRLEVLTLIRRTPGREQATAARMDPFDAITALAPETSSLSRLHRPLHLLADLYDELGGIWLLEYGETQQLIPWINEQMGAS